MMLNVLLATTERIEETESTGVKELLDNFNDSIQMMTRKNMKLELRWEENYDFTYRTTYSSSLDRR